jgi:hypothetical protein
MARIDRDTEAIRRDLEEMRSLNERRRRLVPGSAEYETVYQRETELGRRIRRWALAGDDNDGTG